ncbi:MAG: PQQ-dependent sugar dehydrogenase [Planctomycetes bacterium]|nr:PQQ-dependent sugar dehydrogenase [Planctomycetota bacterium]
MNRKRVWLRLGILLVLAVVTYLIARRAIFSANVASEPIAIDTLSAPVTFERAFPNLEIERPVYVTFPPDGTNRVAVVSQCGSVLIFPNDPSVEQPSELLNIRHKVMWKDGSNEEGLLGLAFHPKFRENRQFFLFYTNLDHINVLSRFTISATDPNRGDPESEVELFRTPKRDSSNHNGGTILFGRDGFLYLAVGDGGPVGDPHGNGQSLETVLGKILRIDVDHQNPGLPYAIPQDNPFVERPKARGEIWAFGLRNVWRMAFDRQTNRLWAGDVGDDTWEEIDLIERGGNYGWRIREGFHRFPVTQATPSPPPTPAVGKLLDPIFAYNHTLGNCIIGGCVYRGKQVPELFGAYLFADHVTGQVYALRYNDRSGKAVSVQRIDPRTMPVLSFGEDESGEVYFTTTQGIINRIVPSRKQQP